MKLRHTPILLIAILFTSCDFFYSTVPFEGSEEKPLLAVNALLDMQENPHIYVSRSFFFTDSARFIRIPDSRYSSGYQQAGSHNGNLSDASAVVTISHQAPKQLHYVCIEQASAYKDELGYYTADDLHFRSQDTVSLRVSHPLYGSVSATQVCPDSIRMNIQSVEMTPYAEAKIRLHIAPYHGNDDDVIYLKGEMYVAGRYMFRRGHITYHHTIPNYSYLKSYLYSYNNAFVDLNTYQSDYGYCAGQYLLLPASAIREGLTVDLLMDNHAIYVAPGEQNLQCVFDTVQLSLTAMTCTNDYHMYVQSVKASQGRADIYIPPLSSAAEVENDLGDIIKDISDIFSELGGQEGTQIQCNVQGGLGHFCLSTTCKCYYEQLGH